MPSLTRKHTSKEGVTPTLANLCKFEHHQIHILQSHSFQLHLLIQLEKTSWCHQETGMPVSHTNVPTSSCELYKTSQKLHKISKWTSKNQKNLEKVSKRKASKIPNEPPQKNSRSRHPQVLLLTKRWLSEAPSHRHLHAPFEVPQQDFQLFLGLLGRRKMFRSKTFLGF